MRHELYELTYASMVCCWLPVGHESSMQVEPGIAIACNRACALKVSEAGTVPQSIQNTSSVSHASTKRICTTANQGAASHLTSQVPLLASIPCSLSLQPTETGYVWECTNPYASKHAECTCHACIRFCLDIAHNALLLAYIDCQLDLAKAIAFHS